MLLQNGNTRQQRRVKIALHCCLLSLKSKSNGSNSKAAPAIIFTMLAAMVRELPLPAYLYEYRSLGSYHDGQHSNHKCCRSDDCRHSLAELPLLHFANQHGAGQAQGYSRESAP